MLYERSCLIYEKTKGHSVTGAAPAGGGALAVLLLVVGCIWIAIGWVPLMGLKVLKPQEALVLTLFGNYIGTLTWRNHFSYDLIFFPS